MSCTAAGADDAINLPFSSSNSSLITHVSYSCGSCGYELNLNSCNRKILAIDAKYGKAMKRGIISFYSIDESRFTQINKVRWLPYNFTSKNSWRLFWGKTKLLCRNCGNCIGTASTDRTTLFQAVESKTAAWDGISTCKTYDIKIRCLRPSSSEGSAMFI